LILSGLRKEAFAINEEIPEIIVTGIRVGIVAIGPLGHLHSESSPLTLSQMRNLCTEVLDLTLPFIPIAHSYDHCLQEDEKKS